MVQNGIIRVIHVDIKQSIGLRVKVVNKTFQQQNALGKSLVNMTILIQFIVYNIQL